MAIYKVGRNVPVGSIDELLKQDGRRTAMARPVLGPRRPSKFSVAMINNIIQQFLKSGSSNHSGSGACLPFIIDYCEEHRIPYTLSAAFTSTGQRCGYSITKDAFIGLDL